MKGKYELNKIVLLILVVFILTGCNGLPNDTIKTPEGKVTVDGEPYKMISGDYEWKENNIDISSKSIPNLNEMAELFETLEVDKGEKLKFEIDQKPSSFTVIKIDEDGQSDNVEVIEDEITMPSESGYYIYQIETIWPNGKQKFVFDVNVN